MKLLLLSATGFSGLNLLTSQSKVPPYLSTTYLKMKKRYLRILHELF